MINSASLNLDKPTHLIKQLSDPNRRKKYISLVLKHSEFGTDIKLFIQEAEMMQRNYANDS